MDKRIEKKITLSTVIAVIVAFIAGAVTVGLYCFLTHLK